MQTLEPILAKHPFFKDFETPYLKLVVGCASNVVFREGQMICRRGGDANRFYLIRHGRVAVELHAAERGTINVQTLGEGDILGWSWLIPPYQWNFGSSDKFVRSFMNGHDFEDEEVVVAKAVGLSLHGLDLVVSSFQRAC
jgi:hypothetical protein